MLPESWPCIPDWNLIRNPGLDPEIRKQNLIRQRRYQLRHKYDKKPFNPDDLYKLPQGCLPSWTVHAICDSTGLIVLVASCRKDGTIQGICGQHGQEVQLSPAISQPDARALVIAMVSTLKPVGNKSPRPRKNGHSIGGNRRESSAFWSTWS